MSSGKTILQPLPNLSWDVYQHRETRPEIRHHSTYRFTRNGSSENSVFRVNAPTFSIITPQVLMYDIYSSTAMFLSRSGIEPYQN